MYTVMIVGALSASAARLVSTAGLSAHGYQITRQSCDNEGSALREIRNQKADLAIVSIDSPDVNGFQLIEACMKNPRPVACVALSGFGALGPIHRALQLGAADYLIQEGLTEPQLLSCINRVQAFVKLCEGENLPQNQAMACTQPVILAKEYIQSHCAEKLSLAGVAQAINFSKGYLGTLFKKETGMNVSDYVSQIKVEKAKTMIGEHRFLMYEIAERLGFESAYYFSKVFKKQTGYSPREYELHTVREQISADRMVDCINTLDSCQTEHNLYSKRRMA